MDKKQEFECIPIELCEDEILCMTFDGCSYYYVLENRVIKTKGPAHIVDEFSVSRKYTHICYDWEDRCFWATADEQQYVLYRLNCQMKETASIRMRGCGGHMGYITGLSYDCGVDKLVVSFYEHIMKVKKNGECSRWISLSGLHIENLACISPGCVIAAYKEGKLGVYFWMPGKCLKKICGVCSDRQIKGMVIDPCSCSKWILQCLIYFPCGRYFLDKTEIRACDAGHHVNNCSHHICHKGCRKPKPRPVDCNDIIESIALEEAALAHILNAEGEKIQKIVACSDDYKEIMCVNREVNETIVNVTMLEQTLYAKLRTIARLCPDRPEHDCCEK